MLDRNFVVHLGLAMLFGFGIGLLAQLNINRIEGRKPVTAVADIVIRDPKTGKELIYKVKEFLEVGESYTRFKTTDGKTVEVLKTDVTEK